VFDRTAAGLWHQLQNVSFLGMHESQQNQSKVPSGQATLLSRSFQKHIEPHRTWQKLEFYKRKITVSITCCGVGALKTKEKF